MEVSGLTNSSSGLFNVTLTSESDSSVVEHQQLSGASSFQAYTTLFYASDLDNSANYTLTITNVENKTLVLDGMDITVISGGNTYVKRFSAHISSIFITVLFPASCGTSWHRPQSIKAPFYVLPVIPPLDIVLNKESGRPLWVIVLSGLLEGMAWCTSKTMLSDAGHA